MAVTYPAGFAIGAGDQPVHRAVVNQAHIDHPSQTPGIAIPEWGLRLWYGHVLFSFSVMSSFTNA